MKLIKFILIFLSLNVYAQSDVPDEYWVDDAGFDEAIKGNAFEEKDIVVIEFWAEFNKENCFAEWADLDVPYYRVDIAKAPLAKKKYRVRMPPTLIIFKDGLKTKTWKAGLDLLIPVDLEKVQEAIDEINKASKF
jgi:hypothetical protein|tara:strand:+ start:7001 stop:7405 length:405 start_codon:yes stop_codon:yes gene_type:complete